jgi:hypothetical protein
VFGGVGVVPVNAECPISPVCAGVPGFLPVNNILIAFSEGGGGQSGKVRACYCISRNICSGGDKRSNAPYILTRKEII